MSISRCAARRSIHGFSRPTTCNQHAVRDCMSGYKPLGWRERRPHGRRFRMREGRRHHASDFVGDAVQHDRPSDHRRIAETHLPETVTQNGDAGPAGRGFRAPNVRPERGRDAQRLEESRRDDGAHDIAPVARLRQRKLRRAYAVMPSKDAPGGASRRSLDTR